MKKSLYSIWLLALFCFASSSLQAANPGNVIELDGVVSEVNLKEKLVSLNGAWCKITYRSKLVTFDGKPTDIKNIIAGKPYLATVNPDSKYTLSNGKGAAVEIIELWIK